MSAREYSKYMAVWTSIEGILPDGLPMRIFLAEHNAQLWAASIYDEVHPKTRDEFVWSLGKNHRWEYAGKRDGGSSVLNTAVGQVLEYFQGNRREFDLPFAWRGTPFQTSVWQQLTRIPYGQVQTYGEVAEAIGNPGASRAVGSANRCNHLALLVPCHRVTAAGGKLGGYTGGLGLKRRLLAHEGAALKPSLGSFRRKQSVDVREEGLRLS
jgi:methylated-DNA-[protein]-cysteine S-methyltransferase